MLYYILSFVTSFFFDIHLNIARSVLVCSKKLFKSFSVHPDNFSSHSREIDFIDKNYHNHICVSNKSNNFALSST